MAKALASVDKQLEEEAANIASTLSAPSSNRIKTNDKVFKLPDGQVLQAPLTVVIIDYTSRNAYYDKPYNAAKPEDPICWAINKEPAKLAPGKDVPNPIADECSDCPYDEFGSSPTGGGKACKNSRVLAVLLPTMKDDKMYTIEASPTAIKAYDAYVGVVAKLFNSSPIKVTTDLSFHPEKSFASLMFGNPKPNPQYGEHFARRTEANDILAIAPISTVSTETSSKKKAPTRRKRK